MEPDDDIPLTERQETFLGLIQDHGTTDTAAAEAAGVSRFSACRWKKDPDFKARYDAARKIGIEHLVKEAERRALNGSDRLLEFLLCNYAPDRFQKRETRDLNHAGGVSLAVITGVPEEGDDLV
jgi:hypothetical protein